MSWNAPVNFGGCPITSYTLYRDDGRGGAVDIQIDPTTFILRPNIFSYDVTLDSSFTGLQINVKVEATNAMGSVTSKAVMFVLASVPPAPFPGPQVVLSKTTFSQITVMFANDNTDNGGSPILQYQLQMDDGY